MGLFRRYKDKKDNSNQQKMSELALSSIRDGVIIVDNKGDIQLINPAAEAMTGYSKDEALGLNYLSVIHLTTKEGQAVNESANPIVQSINANLYSENRNLNLVTRGSNKENEVSIIVTPTGDATANKIITFRDIAKELEEEKERNEFISTASHEMRTPVASIEGYLGLAMNPQTATIDARAADYLEKAHAASQHLGRLFRDLLDTTKLDDSKIKLHNEPVELTEAVKKIADQQIQNITAKGLAFQFGNGNFDEKSGMRRRIGQLIYVDVDLDALQEVIDNVIENAIKYTPHGKITVAVIGEGDKAKIVVEDTGIGIAREELGHIFQKFYRVDNSDTREIGGTGLGLYIARRRIEAMGGKIWAESELGKGSRFYIVLPRISTEEYEKRKLVVENQMAMTVGQSMQQNSDQDYTAPSLQNGIITPQLQTQEQATNPAIANYAIASNKTNVASSPASPTTNSSTDQPKEASNLNPEDLQRLKAEFAQKIRNQQQ